MEEKNNKMMVSQPTTGLMSSISLNMTLKEKEKMVKAKTENQNLRLEKIVDILEVSIRKSIRSKEKISCLQQRMVTMMALRLSRIRTRQEDNKEERICTKRNLQAKEKMMDSRLPKFLKEVPEKEVLLPE